jgi:hypothetical protein
MNFYSVKNLLGLKKMLFRTFVFNVKKDLFHSPRLERIYNLVTLLLNYNDFVTCEAFYIHKQHSWLLHIYGKTVERIWDSMVIILCASTRSRVIILHSMVIIMCAPWWSSWVLALQGDHPAVHGDHPVC